ncbi:hypothetical protein DFH11DRAFT_394060 [Phellopilus nigrolimitatus]|nr:hypothetical protein DFH11DRAFT_394060 [Phellopilus nigrolimitatus]
MDDSSILRELIASDSSSSSASSMATVSDQAGAGRTLYKALRVAGQAVEQQLNRLASRWRPDAQTNSVNTVTMFSPAHPLGELDEETHSNNETASDLPGAGRTLGLLYSSAGRRIEHHSNRAASALGKGPDAVVKRIYGRMPSVPLEDRRVFIVKQSLRSKGQFVGDCQKLLAYTMSDVPSTRHRALEHIASLVVSEPLLRSLFNQLHAITTIRGYRPRSYVCSLDDRDGLLSCSRIALISLSEVEVNKVAKELMLRIRPTKENINKLLDYARHPELSFLALRHLQQSPSFVALTESTFVRFAGIVASCSDLPEWKVVDNIIWTLLEFFFPPLDSSFEDVRRALIKTIILKAERLPRSLHALKRLSSFIDRPDICDNSEIAFRPYSILSSIISDRPGRLDLRKLEHLKDMFPTECLQPLWDSLSGPEMLLVTMMIERNALFQKSSWTGVDLVSDLSKLQEWCQDLSIRIMKWGFHSFP